MWTLIVVVLWYHAPAITEVQGFQSQQTCEAAAVQVNKKFTLDGMIGGSDEYGQSICVQK